VQELTDGQDGRGGKTATWGNDLVLYATIVPQKGGEYFAVNQLNATTDVVFRVRYRTDITRRCRIMFEGQAFDILDLQEIPRRFGLDILARAQQAAR
jgi:SPP1 family predicted phage head-tail adaptor